jgi:hypothetical protein
MSDLKLLNEVLDSALQTNKAMGKKLQQQAALIEKLVGALECERQAREYHYHDEKEKRNALRGAKRKTGKAIQAAREAGFE